MLSFPRIQLMRRIVAVAAIAVVIASVLTGCQASPQRQPILALVEQFHSGSITSVVCAGDNNPRPPWSDERYKYSIALRGTGRVSAARDRLLTIGFNQDDDLSVGNIAYFYNSERIQAVVVPITKKGQQTGINGCPVPKGGVTLISFS
jgi:hypothetical protein